MREKLERANRFVKENRAVLVNAAVALTVATIVANRIRNQEQPKHIYSFGKDSPLKFELSDEFVKDYNGGVRAFLEGQFKYRELHGEDWGGQRDVPVPMRIKKSQVAAFNAFGDILDAAIKAYGKDVTPEELPDDFLVRN